MARDFGFGGEPFLLLPASGDHSFANLGRGLAGLSWPSQWVDYLAADCGPNKLHGIEITKSRRIVADLHGSV